MTHATSRSEHPDSLYLLVIQSTAPYAHSHAQEALDLVLAAAAFDLPVYYLLMGDACYQLLETAQPELNGRKNLSKMMKALPLYGVEHILAEAEVLQTMPPRISEHLALQSVNAAEIRHLIRHAQHVLRF